MRKTSLILALTLAATAFAYADSWTGKLLDASCYDRMKDNSKGDNQKLDESSCAATSQSTAFVLSSSGKVYRLDAAGNTRAAAAMKNHAERSAPAQPGAQPGAQLTKDVMARVEGNETAGTITVTTIDLQ
jgi:hypothetical protein